MKTFKVIALALLLFPLAAQASEIVTLCRTKRSVAVQPTDIVTVVSVMRASESNRCDFQLAADVAGGAPPPALYIAGGAGLIDTPNLTLTGLASVSIRDGTGYPNTELMITLRITTQAEQFVSPPVIMPAVTDENYKVELEASTDLQNWIPAVPGDYLGGGASRFFRVKVATKTE